MFGRLRRRGLGVRERYMIHRWLGDRIMYFIKVIVGKGRMYMIRRVDICQMREVLWTD